MARRQGSRREPTIRDVARAAGVSPATAARALAGYGAVSQAARDRVAAAAAEVGYRPNSVARSMITGSTHTLGVVVADIENPFFAAIVRAVSDVARNRGFEVIVANSDEDLELERAAVHVLFDKRVDGLIIAPAASEHGEHLAELHARGLPIVLIDRVVPGLPADAVVVDNRPAAHRAVRHLIGLGHRRIAIVTGSPLQSLPSPGEAEGARDRQARAAMPDGGDGASRADGSHSGAHTADFVISSTTERLGGYRDAMEEAGLPVTEDLVHYAPYRREGAVDAAHALLAGPDPVTAVFTTDNFMTLGVFEGIREAGRSVPADVSLVGFDDLDWTELVTPPLTVVAQPTYELGRTAAQRLLARIDGDASSPATCVLDTAFRLRASTAPPARR